MKMFYSDSEVFLMARGRGENLRHIRECCAGKQEKNREEKVSPMHRAAAALIALFRF
jgi:hypothetical protein